MRILKVCFFSLAIAVLAAVIVFMLTGCSAKRELEDRAIVSGIGVDFVEDSVSKLAMTVQIVSFQSDNFGEGSDAGTSGTWNLKLYGEDPFEMLQTAPRKLNKPLYLSHNNIIVFSKETAESGLRNYLDFFIRDYETRLSVPLMIAEEKASDVLSVKPRLDSVGAQTLKEMAAIQSFGGQSVNTTVFDFAVNLQSAEKATMIPLVKAEGEGEEKINRITGAAVFREDTMVGTFSPGEVRGILWVTGRIGNGASYTETSNGKISVRTLDASANHTFEFTDDGNIIVKLNIKQTSILGSTDGSGGYAIEQNIHEIQKAVAEKIKDEIKKAQNKAIELNADVYGFGDEIRRKYPSRWEAMSGNWEEVFRNIQLNCNVEVTVQGTGSLVENV